VTEKKARKDKPKKNPRYVVVVCKSPETRTDIVACYGVFRTVVYANKVAKRKTDAESTAYVLPITTQDENPD
jgi:hypothetical protein